MDIKINSEGNPCLEFADLNLAMNAAMIIDNIDFFVDNHKKLREKFHLLQRQSEALRDFIETLKSSNNHYLAMLSKGL